jgi:hypothetical protein
MTVNLAGDRKDNENDADMWKKKERHQGEAFILLTCGP